MTWAQPEQPTHYCRTRTANAASGLRRLTGLPVMGRFCSRSESGRESVASPGLRGTAVEGCR